MTNFFTTNEFKHCDEFLESTVLLTDDSTLESEIKSTSVVLLESPLECVA